MLSTYQDFINHNPRYQQIENDSYFQRVFEFLSVEENIFDMIEFCGWGKPALASCVQKLEIQFPDLLKQNYNDYFIKQSIGTMIKEVLAPFGYIPEKPKRISPTPSKFFKSAHTYECRENLMKLKLVKTYRIEKV